MRKVLVVLYGQIEFDGRVKRVLEVAKDFGAVTLVDVANDSGSGLLYGVDRNPIFLKRSWGQIQRYVRFAIHAIVVARRLRPQLIFAEDYYTPLLGRIIKALTGAKLIYDAHELIIPEGKDAKQSSRDRFWYFCERAAVHESDLVIAANPERARLMKDHYGFSGPVTYMRNIPKSVTPTSEQLQNVLERYPALVKRSEGEKIVLYQGDISIKRGLDLFVRCLDYLPSNVRLVLVGQGPDFEEIQGLGSSFRSSGRFSALGRIGQDLLPAVTQFADVGIVTYPRKGLNNIFCAPNKIFEYVSAGVRVVATDQVPLKEIVERFSIGVLIEAEDKPSDVAQKVLRCLSLPVDMSQARAIVSSEFSSEAESERVRREVAALF
ncbi:glycosyltransferase [Thauera aminoaromatica]|uniref:glycosyltransferase n=1 Tax=Thauera aminoaromatica TaxID=164330 RepID=UPI002355B49A|nr:glycosyltransferase [Thauera aminoaromatica]MCK6399189.1 glycosyltransferase [Thauera aminoaromatica]